MAYQEDSLLRKKAWVPPSSKSKQFTSAEMERDGAMAHCL